MGLEVEPELLLPKYWREPSRRPSASRAAIYEIRFVNENLRSMVTRKETGTATKARAITDRMDTLRHDGWRRVLNGQTTVEEVVRVTQQDEAMTETD